MLKVLDQLVQQYFLMYNGNICISLNECNEYELLKI
jgi:hypothetical protein